MNASAFKMLLGIGQIIVSVIVPFAGGTPFTMGALVVAILGALTGTHAMTSAMTNK